MAGMGLMCFLASGEDPNFGLYAANVKRTVRFILLQQDPETGYYGTSMYHHGFAMLALAEAYGVVDDRNLWAETGVTAKDSITSFLRDRCESFSFYTLQPIAHRREGIDSSPRLQVTTKWSQRKVPVSRQTLHPTFVLFSSDQ